jgi:hypothetical protein
MTAALRSSIGSARVALSSPHAGRTGGYLAYGTLLIAGPVVASGPTSRLPRHPQPAAWQHDLEPGDIPSENE